MRIAILGSSGHVANNLFRSFRDNKDFVYQFSRESIEDPYDINSMYNVRSYNELYYCNYDAIINCVGFGNPASVETAGAEIFRVTEKYDNMCIDYLKIHPSTKYVYISSGVANNRIDTSNLYQLSKIYTETKHRTLPELNIIDIRLYSFFTRFSNLEDSFFMSQLIKSIKNKTEFVTDEALMWRDYINPKDLYSLIQLCLQEEKINGWFNTFSLKPVEKFEILEYFQNKYNLRVKFVPKHTGFSSSNDSSYFAKGTDGVKQGYKPTYTSIDTIKEESEFLLNGTT